MRADAISSPLHLPDIPHRWQHSRTRLAADPAQRVKENPVGRRGHGEHALIVYPGRVAEHVGSTRHASLFR